MRNQQKLKALNHLLFKIDLFAPHYEFYIRKNDTRFSTSLGGLYTIFTIIISLSYGIWNIQQWISGQYLPLITEDLKFFEYKDIKLNQPIGYLNIEIYPALENLTLSYMKQEDLVEGMKLIHKVFDVSLTKSIPIDNQYEFLFDKKLSEENKNVTFTINYEKDLDTDGVDKLAHCELNIFMCRNETKCKDQKLQLIDQLIRFGLRVDISFQTFYYEHQTNQVKSLIRKLGFVLSKEQIMFTSTVFKFCETSIDFGYPFHFNQEKKTFLENIIISTTYIDQKQSELFFNFQKKLYVNSIVIEKLVNKRIVQHQSLMDRIILIASFFRIFISIGSLTIKHRARLLMNKDINKKIVKKSLVRENEKLVKKFFNDKESTQQESTEQNCDSKLVNQNVYNLFYIQIKQIVDQQKNKIKLKDKINKLQQSLEQEQQKRISYYDYNHDQIDFIDRKEWSKNLQKQYDSEIAFSYDFQKE